MVWRGSHDAKGTKSSLLKLASQIVMAICINVYILLQRILPELGKIETQDPD